LEAQTRGSALLTSNREQQVEKIGKKKETTTSAGYKQLSSSSLYFQLLAFLFYR